MDKIRIARQLVSLAKQLVADMPMQFFDMSRDNVDDAVNSLKNAVRANKQDLKYLRTITYQEGESSKFHTFAIFQTKW